MTARSSRLILIFVCAAAIFVAPWGGPWAALWGAAPARADIKQASFVIDANTGAVLHEQFADAPRHPASLTKMMTLYLAFEAIKEGRATADTLLTISERAAGMAPSKLELPPGDQIALSDAVKALITKSANDVAVAIAENLGGSEVEFVRLMNDKARELGMLRTHFTNASGLPDPGQISTARDMVTLGMRLADDFPNEFRLFSTRQFEYRGKVYKSHNTLLQGFPGMDGIKTGYTRMSGFNLVSSVHIEGKHVVAAVFGGTTAATRNAHMRALLFQTLEKASPVRTRPMPKPGQAAPMLVARKEPVVAPPPVIAAEAAPMKSTEKKAEKKAPKPPAEPKQKVAAAAPSAAPAKKDPPIKFRSTTADPSIDQIAAVLRAQEAQHSKAPAAQAPAPMALAVAATVPAQAPAPAPAPSPAPAPAEAAPPRLDLEALRNEMNNAGEEATAPPVETPVAFATATTTAAPEKPKQLSEPLHLREPAAPPPVQAPAPPAKQATAAAAAGTGSFAVQIGAFGNEKEALNRLETVRSRAGALLDGHAGIAQTATRSGKQIYRARFVAFDEAKAQKACSELRRISVDCFVMKSE